MLDEKDLQAIAALIDAKLDKQSADFDAKLEKQSADFDAKLEKQSALLRSEFHAVIESDILPKLQTLAEGQEILLERMVPVSRIEAVESDVVVLKAAVRHLGEEVAELKKAN